MLYTRIKELYFLEKLVELSAGFHSCLPRLPLHSISVIGIWEALAQGLPSKQ